MDAYVYVWPNGDWCYRESLTYFIKYLSCSADTYEALTEEEFYEQFPEEKDNEL